MIGASVQSRSPVGWAVEPLRRFADFDGRSRRLEYWWFFLAQILMHIAFGWFTFSGGSYTSEMSDAQVIAAFCWFAFTLAMLVPNVAVIVRRCHDAEIPAWIGVICYLGMVVFGFFGVVVLILMLIPGKPYDNGFGPDPKGRGVADIFV